MKKHAFNNKFQYKGLWWLPENPDLKVAGIVSYEPNQKITLELIGSFKDKGNALEEFLSNTDAEIIHGETSEAIKITLIKCFVSGSVNPSCSFTITRYSCRFAIIGCLLHDKDEACFDEAIAWIPELNSWCPPSLISQKILDNNSSVAISLSLMSNILAESNLSESTKLQILGKCEYNADFYAPSLRQYSCLRILKSNKERFVSFLSDISLFCQFMSLATLQHVDTTYISLKNNSYYQELENGGKLYKAIDLIYVQHVMCERNSNKSYDFLLNYKSIKDNFSTIMAKWYADKEVLAPIRNHLVESVTDKRIFTSIDFLIVIQAIEGFWSRFRDDEYKRKKKEEEKNTKNVIKGKNNNTRLETILNMLIEEFGDVPRIKEEHIDVKCAVDSRHYYSHFMDKSKKTHALDGLELYELTHKLRKLLICCILSFMGIDNERINKILSESNSSFLRCRKTNK